MLANIINRKIVILEPLKKYGLEGIEPCKKRFADLLEKSESGTLPESETQEFVELKFALEQIEALEA